MKCQNYSYLMMLHTLGWHHLWAEIQSIINFIIGTGNVWSGRADDAWTDGRRPSGAGYRHTNICC